VIAEPAPALNVVEPAAPSVKVKPDTTVDPSTRMSTALPFHPSPHESTPLKVYVYTSFGSVTVPSNVELFPAQCKTES
jgi:hypothetical protein